VRELGDEAQEVFDVVRRAADRHGRISINGERQLTHSSDRDCCL
jgi:hypothetical protein